MPRSSTATPSSIALAAAALVACSPAAPVEEADDPPAASASTAGDEAAEPEPAPPTSHLPAHGERAFGVYLATVEPGTSPDALLTRLEERGYEGGGVAELGCDHGAAEALSLPPETLAVSLAFRTREDAEAFVALWDEPVIGVAQFDAYCRD